MSTREEKVRKSRAKRLSQDKAKETIKSEQTPTIEVNPTLSTPAEINESRNGGTLDASTVTGEGKTITPVVGPATVDNPVGIAKVNRGDAIPTVTQVTGQAVASTPSGVPANPLTKTPTLSDLLAEQRKAAIKEKTDAAKMQKYYALTDALNALGKMGGSAIGGAIGGNALDSAPVADKYQESRGYLDAFERAKQANDRLRKLDEQEFNLAYSKQQRDEERAYNEKVREADRRYQEKREQLNREWQQAVAEKNLEAKAKVEKALLDLRHQHDMEIQALRNEGAIAEKELSKEIVKMQMDNNSSNSSKLDGGVVPVRFSNRKVVDIPTAYYDQIVRSLVGRTINDQFIDADNIRMFIEDNPQLISDYLIDYGIIDTPLVDVVPEESKEEKKKAPRQKASAFNRTTTSGAGYVYSPTINKTNPKAEATKQTDEQDNKENDSRIQIDW